MQIPEVDETMFADAGGHNDFDDFGEEVFTDADVYEDGPPQLTEAELAKLDNEMDNHEQRLVEMGVLVPLTEEDDENMATLSANL